MKVLDNPRGVLHLEHFLSNPFPYQVLVQLSHPSRVEQAWHAINGNFAGVTWQIEHRNAFSNDWINDKENLCRKASSRIFPISSLTFLPPKIPRLLLWTHCQPVLQNCNFSFSFLLKEVFLLCIQFRQWQKTCVNQHSKNPSSEKINRKQLVKNPSVSFRVSPTPYTLDTIFTILLTSVMFFKKVLLFNFFQFIMYYLHGFPSAVRVFTRGLIGRIF